LSLRLRLALAIGLVNVLFWAAMSAWFFAEGRRVREDYEAAGRMRAESVRETVVALTVDVLESEIGKVLEARPREELLPIEIQKLDFWDKPAFRRYVKKAVVVRLSDAGRGPREFFNPRAALVFDRDDLDRDAAAGLVAASLAKGQVIGGESRVAGPVVFGGAPWGGLYLALDDPTAEIRRYDPMRLIGDVVTIAALGASLSIAVLYFIFARDVLGPMEDLSSVAASFAEGDVVRRARATERRDEVGETVAAFNRLLDMVVDYRSNLERKVEAQLETITKKNQELALARRLAATGTLAAGVAHEINNPLGGMLNAIGRLKKPGASEESRAKYLALIEENVERIGAIVRRLLDLSPRTASPGPVDLGAAAKHVAELVRYRAERQGVDFRVDVEPSTPPAFGDRNELTQAMLNLVLNALDATQNGGRVEIRVFGRDGDAAFLVRDDGPGMTPEVLARAFDLFFTTKEAGKGTGLGLAAVHHAVTAGGGTLAVESSPGAGATFLARLPAAPKDGAPNA
jgi:signal transduction histidine kinase